MTVYASRAIPFGRDRRQWVHVVGTSPWVQLVFHPNRLLHDHAMWALKLESKYQRWPWWRTAPPARVWDMRWVTITDVDVVVSWIVTAWTLWRMVRR